MHRSKWITLPLFILSFTATAHSPEEGKILATAGAILYRTHADPEPTSADAPWATGIALIAEGDVDENGGLEIGVFYLNKEYFRDDGGLIQVERAKRIYVTMGYRHWFIEKLSAAAAFSSGYSMGDANIIHAEAAPGLRPDTTAGEKTEYGFDFSLQYEIWKQAKFALVSDARYYAAITGKDHEDANHYGIFLGLRYLVQEK